MLAIFTSTSWGISINGGGFLFQQAGAKTGTLPVLAAVFGSFSCFDLHFFYFMQLLVQMPLMANRVIDSPAVSPVHYDVRRNVGSFHGVSLHIHAGCFRTTIR